MLEGHHIYFMKLLDDPDSPQTTFQFSKGWRLVQAKIQILLFLSVHVSSLDLNYKLWMKYVFRVHFKISDRAL